MHDEEHEDFAIEVQPIRSDWEIAETLYANFVRFSIFNMLTGTKRDGSTT